MSRPLLRPQTVANALDMTSADTYSNPTNINMVSEVGFTINWGANNTGTFSVEVSNDYVPSNPGVVPSDPNTGTWVVVPLSNSIAPSGTAGSAYADIVGISAAWIRVHYHKVSTTGAGAWSAVVAGKAA